MTNRENSRDVVGRQQWLAWLIRVRAVIITFLLGIELVLQQVARGQNFIVPRVPMKYFLAVLVFWYLLDLIYAILLKINVDVRLQAYLQIIIDVVLVTLVVYYTGDLDSFFYFLYPLTVLMGAIVLSSWGAYLIAGLSFVLAGLMMELPFYDLIPSYALEQADLKTVQIKVFTNLAAFLAVAYLSSRLSALLRKTGVELEDKAGKLEDLQALNQDIIQSMRGGLITTDLRGKVLLVNFPGAEILHCSFLALVGRSIESIFPGLTSSGLLDLSNPRAEIDWRTPDNQEKYLGLSVAPLSRNGNRVGYVYQFQDLTQLRQLERQIQLKDRMAAVGRMAAAIAHEIRNPLASIAGSVKLFSGMMNLAPDQQRLIGIVLKESERLNHIITDFLMYSREKTYRFEVANIVEVLEETLTLLQNRPEFDGRYRLERVLPPEPVYTLFDSDRMRQVFWNLGDNALKAMRDGGTLTIEVRAGRRWQEILFRDTGVGLTPQQTEKIFEPFQSEFEGGTGLGLAIAFQIIQAHKGNLRAEPAERGCVFRIELPVAARPAPKEIPAATTVHG